MKRFSSLVLVPVLAFLPACSSSKPAPGAAGPGAAPASAAAKEPVDPVKLAQAKQDEARRRDISAMNEALAQRSAAERVTGKAEILVDPKTGQRLERIPKSASLYVRQGRVFSSVVNDREGFPLVKEDKDAYYIAAPPEAPPALPRLTEHIEEGIRSQIIDIPETEAEKVAPPTSKVKIRLQETSDGLPTTGMWRENFALADLDGDGRPEIVSPPARLSGKQIQIFKLVGSGWQKVEAQFEDPENIGFEYGGVAAADVDGDGRVDIVFGKHGGGPAVAYNLGGFRFRVESRGIVRQMSTRSMEIADLDGDGKPDILVISDEPEYLDVNTREAEGDTAARTPRADGSIPGHDIRAYMQRDGRFVAATAGLQESCFGYSISVYAPVAGGGDPFFVCSCRYQGDAEVLYEFDRAQKKFRVVGMDITERHSAHLGTAIGRYQGFPAAFVTYVKNGPRGGSREISGNGLSVYYKTPDGWKRKRVLKTLEQPVPSQGIAVGDLDGDGLDDIVFADDVNHRLRVFFQRPDGSFEELAADLEPKLVNHAPSVRIADVDGDGRLDVVVMYQYLTGDASKEGGIRVFRNLR